MRDVRQDLALPLPDSASTEHGALAEPLELAIRACRRAAVGPGSHVLITGAGPLGLLVLQTARACGASRVTVTDADPHLLRLAAEHGADDIFETAALSTDLAIDPDVHIECSGDIRAVRDGLSWLAPRGTSVLVGVGAERLDVPFSWIQEKELVITGVLREAILPNAIIH
jgi:L-iditol 2-dehydrogenase